MERGQVPETPPHGSPRKPDPSPQSIPPAGDRRPVPDDRTLLGACAEDLDPLAAVLDLLLDSLAASYVICGSLPPGGPIAGDRHRPPGHRRAAGRRTASAGGER